MALRCFDAACFRGELRIRTTERGESLARTKPAALALPAGTLVIADDERPLGLLFGDTAAGCEVSKRTERVTVAAIGVRGVPDIAVEEALWLAAEMLRP